MPIAQQTIRVSSQLQRLSIAGCTSPASAIPKLTQGNIAPEGTTIQVLSLGALSIDASFLYSGANAWTRSRGSPEKHEVLGATTYSILIDHPTAGLILYDVGPGLYETWDKSWGSACEVFAPQEKHPSQALDEQIRLAGFDIADVKHIVISHLHLDHAGGLQYFKGREDVTIWVHELEHLLHC